MTFTNLLRVCGASALVGAAALAASPALAQGRHAEQMTMEGGGTEPDAGEARERAFGQRAERRAERQAERQQADAPAPPRWQPPQAPPPPPSRDWSRAERRSDVAGERAGRQWNRRDNPSNDWGQARAAQAQAEADARARARAEAEARGTARHWGGGDGGNRWERNRSYGDRERNRTYRDGYRDGARQDAWRDRQQQQDAYRSGYRAGWRADDRYDRGYYGGYGDHRRWSHDWRRDHRYNWYGYRNANRHVFRLGTYYAPYRNYRYSRLSIGFQLGSPFYGSRYWINDPWQYRLPAAYGPYRWVRYYDDALLVDIYSGRVVDVIYDFFW